MPPLNMLQREGSKMAETTEFRIDFYNSGTASWQRAFTASSKASKGYILTGLQGWFGSPTNQRQTAVPLIGNNLIVSPRGSKLSREISVNIAYISDTLSSLAGVSRSLYSLGELAAETRLRLFLITKRNGAIVSHQYVDAYASTEDFIIVTQTKSMLEITLNVTAPNSTITQKSGAPA